MQTKFTESQLRNPQLKRSNEILRTCVHCGFCTATCPTYQVLGDELDSPRGRIYLIKEMLENERPADEENGFAHRPMPVVPRVHDYLPFRGPLYASGGSCARIHRTDIQAADRRTPASGGSGGRFCRFRRDFRLALLGAKLAAPFSALVPSKRMRAMLALAPKSIPPVSRKRRPASVRRGRRAKDEGRPHDWVALSAR